MLEIWKDVGLVNANTFEQLQKRLMRYRCLQSRKNSKQNIHECFIIDSQLVEELHCKN